MFGGDDADNPFFQALQQLHDTNVKVGTDYSYIYLHAYFLSLLSL